MKSNWQRRLRDLLLAGGTLTALACSSGGSGTRRDAGNGTGGGPNFCCNANPDPCCAYQYCNGSMTPACACQLDGGVYNYTNQTCAPEAGIDAGAAGAGGSTGTGGFAGASDAAADH